MASPPPPHAPPLDDAALYPVDVLRIGEVLGIAAGEMARRLGAEPAAFERWVRAGQPLPDALYSRVRELAIEAKRCTLLYLSSDVRRLRTVSGLTQQEMALALGVGATRSRSGKQGNDSRWGSGLGHFGIRAKLLENPPNPAVRECPKCGRTYRERRGISRKRFLPDGLHSNCRGCRSGTGVDYWLRKYGSIF